MNSTKKINVNFSSLVGLKAELLRKHAEVNEIELKNKSINRQPEINKKRKKKNVENMEKNTKELIETDNIVVYKKSKLMLEAKARLYEKLRKSKNNNDNFLVDFKSKLDESDKEFVDETVNENYPIEPEENWVEYQDCFGRTRKCLQEDLPYMQKRNELIKQKIMKESTDIDGKEGNKEVFIQEKEPEIEIMRRKWEEQTQKLTDKIDIHYQDILFDEARTHGVGYYAFSQDEEERAKQQENLVNLRKETERKQMEMKEIKELKERMELNRLKAAKIRQRIRAGLSAEPTEEELVEKSKISFTNNSCIEKNDELANDDIEDSNEKTAHKSAKEVICEKNSNDEDKIKMFGELLSKKNWHVMSQEEWIHKCRAQRISKFGPTYDNFTSMESYNSKALLSSSIDKEIIYQDNGNNNVEFHNPNNSISKLKNSEHYYSVNNESSKYIGSHNQNDKNILTEYNTVTNKDIGKKLSKNLSTISSSATSLNCSSSQDKEEDDLNIPLPEKTNNAIASSGNLAHTIESVILPQNINEDSIMAGLKYLREKFEETHKYT